MADYHEALEFLWRVRNELHLLAQRCNDQMSFELQEHIAAALGYGEMTDDSGELPVERFMRDYYGNARAIQNFSELVIEQCAARASGSRRERDIIRSIDRDGEAGLELPVGRLMTRDPQTCSLEDEAAEVIRRMNEGRFRHMPVLDEGRLAGMVSATDVLRYLARELTDKQREELWSLSLWL